MIFASSAVCAQNTYTLKGSFGGDQFNHTKIYLQQLNEAKNGFVSIDSTTVKDNRFVFTQATVDGDLALRFLSTEQPGSHAPAFFVTEPGEITLSMGQKNLLSGTQKNNNLQAFNILQDSLSKQIESLVQKYSKMDQTSENEAKMVQEGEVVMEQIKQSRYNFAKENIKNDLGEFISLSSFNILSSKQMLELLSLMRPEFKNSNLGQEIVAYYEAKNIKSSGNPYKDIQLKDPKGNNIALSDYVGKNKVVLIDFWASWCGPCIKEMPHVVAAYQKYKDKGFEIVGISLDEEQTRWVSTIDRLKMTWPQMSDLKGWNSAAAKLYGIDSIPYTLLIDQEGRIIETNLRGNDLLRVLQELLD